MDLCAEDFIEQITGKILIGVEFGFSETIEKAEEDGERFLPLPAKIKKAWYGTDCDRDTCIFFEFEDYEEQGDESQYFNVYTSEKMYFKDY